MTDFDFTLYRIQIAYSYTLHKNYSDYIIGLFLSDAFPCLEFLGSILGFKWPLPDGVSFTCYRVEQTLKGAVIAEKTPEVPIRNHQDP